MFNLSSFFIKLCITLTMLDTWEDHDFRLSWIKLIPYVWKSEIV